MRIKKKPTNHPRSTTARSSGQSEAAKLRFIEHLHELRRRLYYIIASVLLWGCAAYAVQQHVVNVLLRPARGEHFIYTTPGGGIDFLFRICLYGGVVFSLPIIVYNTLRFIEPVLAKGSTRFILLGSFISGLLAAAGIVFGYYLGLPAALHFLLHQFTTVQIQPLITIQSYLGFVIVYMVGAAMLFQVPLLLIFINRIKPLKPRRLLRYERWVILMAFVLAGLMNPTPNIISQLLVAGPFILMYQVGIGLIALINRQRKPSPVESLYQQDLLFQADRRSRASSLRPLTFTNPLASGNPRHAVNRRQAIKAGQLAARRGYQPNPGPAVISLRPRQEIYALRGQPRRTFSVY